MLLASLQSTFQFAIAIPCSGPRMNDESQQSYEIERLLQEGVDGVEGGYEELLERAAERLYTLTRRMFRSYPRLRRWEQTDDVFQTAALRLHKSLTDVQPESTGQFMGLAATQIRRTLIDLVRHHFGPEGRHARHHSDAADVEMADDGGTLQRQPASAEEPESLESWLKFHESVESLPIEERMVFELIWYGNLTQQQVSELHEISISTVKRRMRSVRIRLGEALASSFPLE